MSRAVPSTKKQRLRVRNLTRSVEICDRAGIADSSETRRTGLLKHAQFEPGDGLWIVPCEAVHTIGMKFAIDVVFLSRKREIVKIREKMGKWRFSGSIFAHSVLELPAGTCERTGTVKGDQLELERYDV